MLRLYEMNVFFFFIFFLGNFGVLLFFEVLVNCLEKVIYLKLIFKWFFFLCKYKIYIRFFVLVMV